MRGPPRGGPLVFGRMLETDGDHARRGAARRAARAARADRRRGRALPGAALRDPRGGRRRSRELDLADVPPTSHPLEIVNVLGRGRAAPPVARRRSRTRRPEDGFRVPRIPRLVTPDTPSLPSPPDRGGADVTRSTRCASPPRRRSGCSSAARSPRAELSAPTAPRSTSATASCTPTCTLVDEPDGDGVPIALKDVISTKGVATTAGSKILEGYVPRLRLDRRRALQGRAGCRCSARRTRTSSRWAPRPRTRRYGPTHNPWDPERVPGGSGGGSAAAVAAGLAPWALGSDTGGSIKQPSALCGNVGLRPTYGTVSRYGIVAFASSLDQVGPVDEDRARLRAPLPDHRRPRPARLDHGRAARAGRAARRPRTSKGLRIGVPKRAERGRGDRARRQATPSRAAIELCRGARRRGRRVRAAALGRVRAAPATT